MANECTEKVSDDRHVSGLTAPMTYQPLIWLALWFLVGGFYIPTSPFLYHPLHACKKPTTLKRRETNRRRVFFLLAVMQNELL